MAVATTKLSSKGQVVIPESIRKQLHLKEGDQFVVVGEGDAVIFKTISPPFFGPTGWPFGEGTDASPQGRSPAVRREGRRGLGPFAAEMIRVVIDTNVLVSGTFWSGPPASVLIAWRKKYFHWLVSPEILGEYRLTLGKLAGDFPLRARSTGSNPSPNKSFDVLQTPLWS